MKIENTEVYGFQSALRAVRNPKDSWKNSDSCFYDMTSEETPGSYFRKCNSKGNICVEYPIIGPKDMKLCKTLIAGGSEHRKFLRQIMIWVDFVLPRYIWQELDTYKVATVRNSCSTMHKLGHRDLVCDDFEDGYVLPITLQELNRLGMLYRRTKQFKYVKEMKQMLPEGFLQRATYTMNYETALNMFLQRYTHRNNEFRFKSSKYSICKWIFDLPYFSSFLEVFFEIEEVVTVEEGFGSIILYSKKEPV